MNCGERCNVCAEMCNKTHHSGRDYHKCSACGTLWYGITVRSFPYPGWWWDRWWMLQGQVGSWLGFEYHIAAQKGENTGWRRRVRTYLIVRRDTQIIFKCKSCPFEIDTALYRGVVGNARTKAATVMHEHYQADHVYTRSPSTKPS
jgi:hypothetical protein